MRPSCAAALLLAILLAAGAGCQQTSQTTAGTPSTPIGPLAPTNPGAAGPSLGPFGAPTRVPPPATGSYSAPNNYLGGGAPGGQAYSPTPARQDYASAPGRLQPLSAPASAAPLQPAVGSGIRQTGWSDSNATAGQPNPPASNTPASMPAAAAARSNGSAGPRLGGLPVNDLTGAPPPPGYQRPPQRYRAGAGTFRGYRQPSPPADTLISSPAGSGGAGTAVPLRPERSATPASGEVTPEQPSTEPAADQHDQSKLPWRRPGSQY